MLENLLFVLLSILALCVVVVVHEWGHFIVAKKSGMAVEVFSVGFGKPLWSIERGGTRYQIAPILLGGYVKPKGEFEVKEGEESKVRDPDEFLAKPWYVRAAVLLAGPIMNFIFPLLVLFVLYASVGKLEGPPMVEAVMEGKPAAEAGMLPGDTLLEIDGIQAPSFTMLARLVDGQARSHPGKPLKVSVLRDGKTVQLEVLAQLNHERGQYLMGIQIKPGNLALSNVVKYAAVGTPAEQAGIKAGDIILKVNEKTVRDGASFPKLFSRSSGETVNLEVERGGKILTLSTPKKQPLPEEEYDIENLGLLGLVFDVDLSQGRGSLYKPLGFVDAARHSFYDNLGQALGMGVGIYWMVTGKINASDNLGGPITIMRMAHQRSKSSMYELIEFMCMISLILGIMNLLPIPLLGGGTFVFCLLEGIRGKPLSLKAQSILQNVGLVLLGSLMIYATYNDIVRWVSQIGQ